MFLSVLIYNFFKIIKTFIKLLVFIFIMKYHSKIEGLEIKNKKAQEGPMGMSFGVIFSIILIAVFVFAAIYAISFFLNYGKCTQVGNFYDNLQRQVNEAALGSVTQNKVVQISLPGGVETICFANLSANTDFSEYPELEFYYLEDANVFLLPSEDTCDMPYRNINRLNVTRIIQEHGNPYCFSVENDLLLNRGVYDRGVSITAG